MAWPVGRPAHNRVSFDEDRAASLYLSGVTVVSLARQFGVSPHRIRGSLTSKGITIRPYRSEPEWRNQLIAKAKERHSDPEYMRKFSERLTGRRWKVKGRTEEHNSKIGDALRGKPKSSETRAKLSEVRKLVWLDPEYRDKWALSNFKARNMVANKSEVQLLRVLNVVSPGSFIFNDVVLVISGKLPDFVDLDNRRIVELYGDYWHTDRGETTDERVELFKRYGYDAIVVWEHELADEESLVTRLRTWLSR